MLPDTVRLVLAVRSYRYIATCIGFTEILIWVTAAGLVFQNVNTSYLVLAYAARFAAGNFDGIWLKQRFAMGLALVRMVSRNVDMKPAERLRKRGYSVIELSGTSEGDIPVEVLLKVERRRKTPRMLQAIWEEDPTAFWTFTDVKRQQPVMTALKPDLASASIQLK